jgi:hypothetical protein
MVNDIATFEAAVARADADGEIYYVPGQGFTTITAAERSRANTTTWIAAGTFFATDFVPMMFTPTSYEPVTQVRGVEVPVRAFHEMAKDGPYSDMPDSPSVDKGKDYTPAQKRKIMERNRERNGGVLRDDVDGTLLVPAQKSLKGVTPPENEAALDHGVPAAVGGSNSNRNARVRARAANAKKGMQPE